MADQAIIDATNLSKVYGELVAVNRLNLQVQEGEIFGFLGPNGAGKTTTILMLLGLTEPTTGAARVCGYNSAREPLKVKRLTGYLPENVGFYGELTARQNLMYTARLNAVPEKLAVSRVSEMMEVVGLPDVGDKKVAEFSRGMKQRLGIADVLIKDPKVIILDEPTLGIDPDGSARILDLIVDLSHRRKMTIMLSSHMLYQVQRICSRVGILVKGKMVALGSVDQLGKKLEAGKTTLDVEASPATPELVDSIKRIPGVLNVEKSGDLLTIAADKEVRSLVAKAVTQTRSALLQMRLQDYTLEEIYLRYFREAH
ncbi:MAG: ABC transporter ATP-binding protein [Chloroflexi bacterium]|nr:ABC transporter ATP-binding protein [Chloroflexota bacterium]